VKKFAFSVFVVAFAFAAGGCASVPKSSVQLSETIGRDLGSMRDGYVALVRKTYERARLDAREFVWKVYAPGAIRAVLQDDPSTDFTGALSDVKKALDQDREEEALEAMSAATRVIMNDIHDFERSLVEPLDEQEQRLVQRIDESFALVIRANATITRLLSSASKVEEAHQEFLRAAGLEDLKADVEERIVRTESLAQRLESKFRELQAKGGDPREAVDELKERLKSLLGEPEEGQ